MVYTIYAIIWIKKNITEAFINFPNALFLKIISSKLTLSFVFAPKQ